MVIDLIGSCDSGSRNRKIRIIFGPLLLTFTAEFSRIYRENVVFGYFCIFFFFFFRKKRGKGRHWRRSENRIENRRPEINIHTARTEFGETLGGVFLKRPVDLQKIDEGHSRWVFTLEWRLKIPFSSLRSLGFPLEWGWWRELMKI